MHSDRFRYSAANCSIARTLGVVGEKWTLLILREAFYGVRRFDDFHTALGCARNLLASRLKTLVVHGLLERVSYTDERGRGRQIIVTGGDPEAAAESNQIDPRGKTDDGDKQQHDGN